jgi:hypothetical protein
MNENTDYSKIIDALGGSAKVARDLGFNPTIGVQRVNNWKKRGIPARVLLNHRRYFDKAKQAA